MIRQLLIVMKNLSSAHSIVSLSFFLVASWQYPRSCLDQCDIRLTPSNLSAGCPLLSDYANIYHKVDSIQHTLNKWWIWTKIVVNKIKGSILLFNQSINVYYSSWQQPKQVWNKWHCFSRFTLGWHSNADFELLWFLCAPNIFQIFIDQSEYIFMFTTNPMWDAVKGF